MTSVGRKLWADGRNVLEGTKMKIKADPIHFCIQGEIEPMSVLTATVSLVINPATSGSGLAFTPNSNLLAETEGVADTGQVLGTVSGGTGPYTFSVTGVPNGMALAQQPSGDGVAGDVDVVISGTPDVGDAATSPDTITLTITDSAATPATLRQNVQRFPANRF
jgi:hypothetical protein